MLIINKIKHGFSLIELAQYCYEIERPETRERELNSLIKALTFYKMREGSIYTFDFENEEQKKPVLICLSPMLINDNQRKRSACVPVRIKNKVSLSYL